jgi:hypothetical protein
MLGSRHAWDPHEDWVSTSLVVVKPTERIVKLRVYVNDETLPKLMSKLLSMIDLISKVKILELRFQGDIHRLWRAATTISLYSSRIRPSFRIRLQNMSGEPMEGWSEFFELLCVYAHVTSLDMR